MRSQEAGEGVQSFEYKRSVCLLGLCMGTTLCVCVCLNTIVVLHSLHLQLRDTGAKMMDLLINIFIHFKI